MSVEYADHQKRAIAYQQNNPYNILAMSTGTGKSVTTIGSMLMNLYTQKLNKCVFVCTKGSIGEVENDMNKFYSFKPMELNSFENVYRFFSEDNTVAVTRYEWLKHFDINFMQKISQQNNIGFWWDEAQRLKNGSKDDKGLTGTQAHIYARNLRPLCKTFSLVTATPIMCTLDDLWSLMHLTQPEILGTFDTFCNNFYERQLRPHPRLGKYRKTKCPTCGSKLIYNNGFDWCPNPWCQSIETPNGFIPYRRQVKSVWELIEYKNVELLSQLIKPYMFCYFPKQNIEYHIHNFELSGESAIKYNNVAKDLLNENSENTMPFATRLIELQYVVDRSKQKAEELYRLANKIKHKGFVLYLSLYGTNGYYDDKSTLDKVCEVLDQVEGLSYKTYCGKDDDDERSEAKKWFQSDPVNKCLIITEAGGASLNLQQTDQFVFLSMPQGFGKISQALGRIVRLFSTFKTFHIHVLQASQTIDEYKFMCFTMMSEIIYKLMNNQLIELKTPINYNSTLKSLIRNKYCWKNS